jgi:import inner membrane translocase subunit TIM21
MRSSLRLSPLSLRASNPFSPTFLASSSVTSNGLTRWYATHGGLGGQSGSGPTRKHISVISDDGRYKWSELSGKEKVARATQQSFNFVIVILGVVMTVSFLGEMTTATFC